MPTRTPMTQQAQARLVRILRDGLPDLAAVYLFGSVANGDTHAESDVDVAVLPAQPLPPMQRFELAAALAERGGADVDLVDLRSASTVMRAQVVRTGRVLFDGDPEARQRFEVYALASYFDLEIERAAILADIHERGRVYG